MFICLVKYKYTLYIIVCTNSNINIFFFLYNFWLDEEMNVRIDLTIVYRYEIKYVFP